MSGNFDNTGRRSRSIRLAADTSISSSMSDSVLTPLQRKLLDAVSRNASLREHFYLSGGTALAGFYLFHRYSEDLDFFSEKEFDLMHIGVFFKSIKATLGYSSIDSQQSFNRNLFFLKFDGGEILKTEFTYFPFPRIEESKKEKGLSIDSLLDIAVNKLFTIHQQPRARDYVDLFCICQREGFSIADLTVKARIKFDWNVDPLQLGTQFLRATEVRDYPKMLQKLAPETWKQFFREEAKKLQSAILE